ncbi:MAG: hypothetical protein DMG33_13475 [Acidobacteria bacterium]|nr:MAG: hypothetical protein DMG33_13475 [Acidobacteriota bacterium]
MPAIALADDSRQLFLRRYSRAAVCKSVCGSRPCARKSIAPPTAPLRILAAQRSPSPAQLEFVGLFYRPAHGQQFENPGYARFDVSTNYEAGRGLSFNGRVTNLFDKAYQDALGFPALGRDFRLGMRYRFGGKE